MNTLTLANHTEPPALDFTAIKARQKSTWETGDFGQVARYVMPAAEEFVSRLGLRRGMRVLDVACGTGNVAVVAARMGCLAFGVDIASNLIAQARTRAQRELLTIEYTEGDAEDLPYADESFDAVLTMFGAMFTPRPEITAAELLRVIRPGGLIAMANWTPEGFVGEMFAVLSRYVPLPAGLPSPLMWGTEQNVQDRFGHEVTGLQSTRRTALMRFPFSPGGTVEFFRKYFGPTQRAFGSLDPSAQAKLRDELEQLQSQRNRSGRSDETEIASEYLEVRGWKVA